MNAPCLSRFASLPDSTSIYGLFYDFKTPFRFLLVRMWIVGYNRNEKRKSTGSVRGVDKHKTDGTGDADVKKRNVLLCGITAALLMTGCGEMPELTETETEIISEYAVGVLMKHNKMHSSRLVNTAIEEAMAEEEETEPVAEGGQEEEEPEETAVVDVSQDEEESQPAVSSVEQYYGISNITISYTGYETAASYPPQAEGEAPFFSMDATPGTDLLVLKFNAQNQTGEDQSLNLLGCGARFRVSVNGEASKGALATMLVNDMQTFDSVIPANSAVEMVTIVEVPQGTGVDSIDMILRGGEQDGTLHLQ